MADSSTSVPRLDSAAGVVRKILRLEGGKRSVNREIFDGWKRMLGFSHLPSSAATGIHC